MADGLACPFRCFRGEEIDGLSNHAMTRFFETSPRIEAGQKSSFRPRCRARLSIVVTLCIDQYPSIAYLHAPTG
ncbi:hypothetical protein QR685DRAFT_571502 [Neurospora intermedia]|uniref:Uncharacterized protein n=1 Tax=Neurospora intermedia TaxID=5142 RepID=A0ABR3DCH1_NEUIN